jgi:histidinol-phosphate aminotransferase
LKVTPSVCNFILVHFAPHGKTAQEANAFLASRGLIVRAVEAYHLPHALRITIGSQEANELVLRALRDFMTGS